MVKGTAVTHKRYGNGIVLGHRVGGKVRVRFTDLPLTLTVDIDELSLN